MAAEAGHRWQHAGMNPAADRVDSEACTDTPVADLEPLFAALGRGDWEAASRELSGIEPESLRGDLHEALAAMRMVYDGRPAQALNLLVAVLPRLERGALAAQLGSLYGATGYALGMVGDPGRGLEWSQRALQRTAHAPHSAGRRRALSTHGTLLAMTGDAEGAWTALQQVLQIAQAEGDARAVVIAHGNLAFCAMERAHALALAADDAARIDSAQRALHHAGLAQALAEQAGLTLYQGFAATSQGNALLALGRHEAAVRALQPAVAQTTANPPMQADALLGLERALRAQGDLAAARQVLRQAEQLIEGEGLGGATARLLEQGLELAQQQGDLNTALGWAQRAIVHWKTLQSGRDAMHRRHAELFAELERSRQAIAELQEQSQSLQQAAHRDPLTGALNRRAWQRWQTQSGSRACGLALIDVDHFKRINDRFGHALGDAVLVALADLLRRHCRHEDLLVRLGGEEFLLVFVGANLPITQRSAERVRAAVEAHAWVALHPELQVRISVGLAQHGEGDESFDLTLARADAALYRAKDGGRNRVVSAPADSAATGP